MRLVLNVEARRTTPCTSYPFARSSSARYEPSCPVMPVMRARFINGKPQPMFYLKASRQDGVAKLPDLASLEKSHPTPARCHLPRASSVWSVPNPMPRIYHFVICLAMLMVPTVGAWAQIRRLEPAGVARTEL